MKVLLDSHALIWSVDAPAKLGPLAVATLQDPHNELIVSAATIWEIAVKVGLGKLTLSEPYLAWINQSLSVLNATILSITVESADLMARLPLHHRDPFDRLLLAQAQLEGLGVVSADAQFDAYGVNRIW